MFLWLFFLCQFFKFFFIENSDHGNQGRLHAETGSKNFEASFDLGILLGISYNKLNGSQVECGHLNWLAILNDFLVEDLGSTCYKNAI